MTSSEFEIASKYLYLYEILMYLERRMGKYLPYVEIEKEALKRFKKKKEPMTKERLREMLSNMVSMGSIYFPRKNFVTRMPIAE